MEPFVLSLTGPQVQLFLAVDRERQQAQQARDRAAEKLQLVVSALTAGRVPDGATLVALDVDRQQMTFRVPDPNARVTDG